ncbi:MAG TPA: NlpC/P60 family protein [Bacillales bacterium]
MAISRKLLVSVLGLSLVLPVIGIHPASADTTKLEDLESQLNQIEKKKAETVEKVNQLAENITDTTEKIEAKQSKIEETQNQVDELKKNIMETQKRINRREDLLKSRVQVMYKNGGAVNYLQVLLGSQTFSDFLDRVFALNLIMEQDKRLLIEQKRDKEKLKEDKEEIKKTLKNLQSQLEDIEDLKGQLENQRQQALNLVEDLEAQGSEVKDSIAEAKKKIAEARARKERERREAAAARESRSSHHSGSSNSSSVPSGGSASGSVQDLVQAARGYIGNSVYVFGGGRNQADIRNGVFDCSSFVHWAYAQIGVYVGSSTSVLSHQGVRVSLSEIQPGDMVFFNTYKTNGHVGIYIGNGKFIGCQSSSGVSIESLNASYWRNHFTGHVRRVM